jgi:hypothetical protein
LELDGYCRRLGLAFEHQGQQHLRLGTFFIRTQADFRRRLFIDRLKVSLCRRHGVTLIPIPELFTTLPLDELRAYIKSKCIKSSIPLPRDFDSRPIELKDAYSPKIQELTKMLKTLAKQRGGRLLSPSYLRADTSLRWQCAKGHQWEAQPNRVIKRGDWCPYCQGKGKTILDMKQFAANKGGRCLSDRYRGMHSKMKWECPEGHRWMATPGQIMNAGSWCPICASARRAAIRKARAYAKIVKLIERRGGVCLTPEKEYQGYESRLNLQCRKGHRWTLMVARLYAGNWCPSC